MAAQAHHEQMLPHIHPLHKGGHGAHHKCMHICIIYNSERQLSHGPHALPAARSPCEYHITLQATLQRLTSM